MWALAPLELPPDEPSCMAASAVKYMSDWKESGRLGAAGILVRASTGLPVLLPKRSLIPRLGDFLTSSERTVHPWVCTAGHFLRVHFPSLFPYLLTAAQSHPAHTCKPSTMRHFHQSLRPQECPDCSGISPGPHFVAQAGLGLTMWSRLFSNS